MKANKFRLVGVMMASTHKILPYDVPTESWQGKKVCAFGDSIMLTTAGLVADAYGYTINNYCGSGETCPDQSPGVFAQTPAAGDVNIYWLGTNDKIKNAADITARLNDFSACHLSHLLHLAIKDSGRVKATAMTAAGTWSNLANSTYASGRSSTTNGSTLTGTVSGTTVALCGYWNGALTGGTFTVTIDGVNKGTFNCFPSYTAAALGNIRNYGSWSLLFTGLSAGSHSVVITVSSATGSNNQVFINWIAGLSAGSVVTTDPLVVVANTHDFTAAENTTRGTTTALNTKYKNAIAANVTTCRGYGLNVVLVDMDAVLGDSDLADGMHPTHAGYLKARDAYVTGIG